MTNPTNQVREQIDEILRIHYNNEMTYGDMSDRLESLFTSTLTQRESEIREEVLKELADVPRATVTHLDGSKSVVILQHSLETHGLASLKDQPQ